MTNIYHRYIGPIYIKTNTCFNKQDTPKGGNQAIVPVLIKAEIGSATNINCMHIFNVYTEPVYINSLSQ